MKKIVYVDMDGVKADFYQHPKIAGEKRGYGNYPEMYEPNFFFELPPIPGALEAMEILLSNPYLDIWVLTQPVKESPHSYMDKVKWVKRYFPDLVGKIIMTQDKIHLAGPGRTLIDDNLKWSSGWQAKGGRFIHFNEDRCPRDNWAYVLGTLAYIHQDLHIDQAILDKKIARDLSTLDSLADAKIAEAMRKDF